MNEQKQNTPAEKDFFKAIKQGALDTVCELLDRDPDLLTANDYDEFGASCLNLVCGHRNNRPMTELLIQRGADPNQESDWTAGPWSPAVTAAEHGNTELVAFLISNGATVTIHLAALLGDTKTVADMLVQDPELIHTRGGDGCTPLHFATSIDVVDCLLQAGANIEARCVDHYSTPVQWIAKRNPEVARYLFTQGATPDIISACLAGDVSVTRQLLEANPEILTIRTNLECFPPPSEDDIHNILTYKVGYNATPLHAAAIGNQPAIVDLLVSSGLDVNELGAYDDCTALHLAAWEDNVLVAQALLNNGADKERRSGALHNNTPLGWAIVAGSLRVATELVSRGCTIHDYYHSDTEHGAQGSFQEFKSTPKEQYKKIALLLQEQD